VGEECVIHRKLKGPAEGINIEESMKREARGETKRQSSAKTKLMEEKPMVEPGTLPTEMEEGKVETQVKSRSRKVETQVKSSEDEDPG